MKRGSRFLPPTSIEAQHRNADYAGGTWAVVSVDRATLRVRAKRINITMPERILDAVNRYAERRGETRSGLLARAVTDYIARQGNAAVATVSQRAKKSRKPNGRN